MIHPYVHGHSEEEHARLSDQARTLAGLLHDDTAYARGATLLEAGCGVGAQTVELARRSPGATITSIDISVESLAAARRRLDAAQLGGVTFERADLMALPFASGAFEHAFVCFVLEHLRDPAGALAELRRVVRPGGTITVIEGDHGSCFFHPAHAAALEAWRCLIEVQARLGGDSLIGRRLHPLLRAAGLAVTSVSPRTVYCDARDPALVHGFVRRTITGMVAGVRQQAIDAGLLAAARFDDGLAAFGALADDPAGTFVYTFFKAVARVEGWR